MMISQSQSMAIAALFVGSVLATPSKAQVGAYDGLWSFAAVAQSGDCNQYSYVLRITEGRITYAGSGASASGRVNAKGGVSGNIQALGQTVSARGRLAGSRGGGTWNGAGCSGRWQAEKQA